MLSEDTDLIVLLLRRTPTSGSVYVYLVPERSNASNKGTKVWHIQRCQEDIGPRLCQADRAFRKCHGGRYTTSLLYGISNNVPLKRLSADDSFMQTANGLVACKLYGEHDCWNHCNCIRIDEVDHVVMRRSTTCYTVASEESIHYSKTTVLARSLSPTSSSAKYHSFRAYYDSSCLVLSCLVLSCLVLSYVQANTPMESNVQWWGAWSSLVEMC